MLRRHIMRFMCFTFCFWSSVWISSAGFWAAGFLPFSAGFPCFSFFSSA